MVVKLNKILNKISTYPNVQLTQLDTLEFKIRLTGDLMETYMQLGEIQEEIMEAVDDRFIMDTILGDGQDAIFKFKLKQNIT